MKYIIMIMQEEGRLAKHLEELIVCNIEDEIIYFDTLDDADNYREDGAIDGQIIEVPLY